MTRPIPAKGAFPYDHRTVAEVDRLLARCGRVVPFNDDRLAWCPAELRDDYRLLSAHLGAAEARATIERQIMATGKALLGMLREA